MRLSYPKPFVELALSLAARVGIRELASRTDIPLSVIYRWRSQARQTGKVPAAADSQAILNLLGHCPGIPAPFDSLLNLALHVQDDRAAQAPLVDVDRPKPFEEDRASINTEFLPGDVQSTIRAAAGTPREDTVSRLEAARRLIHENYFEAINCARLAAAAGMSPTYFIRMFGDVFGMSPHQYLLRVRLAAAKELLARSTESIDVIAAGVGFRTGAALGRAFKRMEGKTVSEVHAFTSQRS